ncbi:MAG: DUF167 domain-containing protein [Candidatus Omnitrophota bacterium]
MKIEVKVFPGSKRELVEEKDGKVKIYVHSPPDKGKANARVVELVAEKYGVRKSQVKIVRGVLSRNKILEVEIDR